MARQPWEICEGAEVLIEATSADLIIEACLLFLPCRRTTRAHPAARATTFSFPPLLPPPHLPIQHCIRSRSNATCVPNFVGFGGVSSASAHSITFSTTRASVQMECKEVAVIIVTARAPGMSSTRLANGGVFIPSSGRLSRSVAVVRGPRASSSSSSAAASSP